MHKVFDPASLPLDSITFDDFLRIDTRAGTVLEASLLEGARNPSLKLVIDFGEGVGVKKSAAQITELQDASLLVGTQDLAVVNFPPRQIGKFMSQVLVLGVPDSAGNISVLRPSHRVPNGARMS